LKLRVEGLENKNTGENSKNDIRDRRVANTDRRRDGEDDIIRRIKIDPPTSNGIFDPNIFSDWIADLDHYFNWYRFTEDSRIQLARMRLSGSARIYWISVKRVVH